MSRRPWIVALAVLTVVGVAVGGWVWWSARVAGDVTVAWSTESPRCEGTTVRTGSGRPVIEAKRAMRCVVTVQVTDDSRRSVRVDEAVAPIVGPRTGAVVTAENAEPADRGSAHEIDALLPLDRDLPAGDSTAFDIVLVFRPAGCNDSGTVTAPGWPKVTVTALGRSHDLHGDRDFVFRRDGATPGCRH